MFTNHQITKSTESCLAQIQNLKQEINNADAMIIGAGAGLSTAAGFTYSGDRFEKYFFDFKKKYHFTDAQKKILKYF